MILRRSGICFNPLGWTALPFRARLEGGDGLIKRLSGTQSCAKQAVTHAEPTRPFCYAARIASECGEDSDPSVCHLLQSRRPTTIAGFVASFVVDAVKLLGVGRRVPHIGMEVHKVSEPARAHRNSTASIVRILITLRMRASAKRGVPGSVGPSFTAAMLGFKARIALPFAPQAPATRFRPHRQPIGSSCRQIATITPAFPFASILGGTECSHDNKAFESLSKKRIRARHSFIIHPKNSRY